MVPFDAVTGRSWKVSSSRSLNWLCIKSSTVVSGGSLAMETFIAELQRAKRASEAP